MKLASEGKKKVNLSGFEGADTRRKTVPAIQSQKLSTIPRDVFTNQQRTQARKKKRALFCSVSLRWETEKL